MEQTLYCLLYRLFKETLKITTVPNGSNWRRQKELQQPYKLSPFQWEGGLNLS